MAEENEQLKSWYEKLGFKANPFFIEASNNVVGLAAAKKQLLDYITAGHMCLLHGPWGSGKTSLAMELISKLEPNGYTCIYLDGKATSNENVVFSEIYKKKISFLHKLGLRKSKVVAFIDEFSFIDSKLKDRIEGAFNEKQLPKGEQKTPLYSVVVIQIDEEPDAYGSFKSRLSKRKVSTQPLNFDECMELIKYRLGGENNLFTNDALKIIIEEYKRIPRMFLEACEEIAKRFIDKKDITEEPIGKNDVANVLSKKQINVSEEVREEQIKKELSIVPDTVDASPLQKEILEQLYIKPKTLKDLANILNRSVGTIGKQISLLKNKRGYVRITKKTNPKLYDLDIEFKRKHFDKK